MVVVVGVKGVRGGERSPPKDITTEPPPRPSSSCGLTTRLEVVGVACRGVGEKGVQLR